GDSQLPDTQGGHSDDGTWVHSQAHGLLQHTPSQTPSAGQDSSQSQPSQAPVRHVSAGPRGSINALLNDPVQEEAAKHVIIDESFVKFLHVELTTKSSGCSIEQL